MMHDGKTGCTEEERAVDVVYLAFKAFNTVSHDILTSKLRERGLNEWTLRYIENCPNGRANRVVISGVP